MGKEIKFPSIDGIEKDSEPTFTNENGKFWIAPNPTDYARRKGLRGWIAYYVELNDGSRAYLLVNGKGQPMHEYHQYEGLLYGIDMYKILESKK